MWKTSEHRWNDDDIDGLERCGNSFCMAKIAYHAICLNEYANAFFSSLIMIKSPVLCALLCNIYLQYIPRNMHTVFALLCFVVVIHWLIFPYLSGLLHWHCGNLTIAPVPAKQPWWIWRNTSCEFIMNDCITTTKQSTTKPCAYFLGYTVYAARLLYCDWDNHMNIPVPVK